MGLFRALDLNQRLVGPLQQLLGVSTAPFSSEAMRKKIPSCSYRLGMASGRAGQIR